MATIINAASGTGLAISGDGSGIVKLQSAGVTTNALAWGNYLYNGAAAPTLRAAYNVSSLTRNSIGNYTINLTTATTDVNYTLVFQCQTAGYITSVYGNAVSIIAKNTTSFQIGTGYVANTTGSPNTAYDAGFDFAIFGN